ncbi:unnamed protein product [Rangifer tarandus platyrhynchus]|uniref:Uncharacterized protein n=2 Tax=Rangifer tarandus platyrhynchus TaxID=3082113 RepID=A0AC59ZVK8_RANTA|nr:unnamed protein product [Rangifer tarandus platyrhynchus]
MRIRRPPSMLVSGEQFIRIKDSCCHVGLTQHHLYLEIGGAETPPLFKAFPNSFVYGCRPLKYCMAECSLSLQAVSPWADFLTPELHFLFCTMWTIPTSQGCYEGRKRKCEKILTKSLEHSKCSIN